MTTQEHYPIAAQMDAAWPANSLALHGERLPYVAPIFGAFIADALQNVNATGPVVEIGAGIGYLGQQIPSGFRDSYVQTEIGPENCLHASRRNPDLKTIAARAQDLPFRSGSVGTILARNLFDMVDTPAVIAEISRVLRPGGLALHMRDHRPSLVWLHNQIGLGESKRLIPHFDAQGSFKRMQVITAAKLAKVTAEHPIMDADTVSNPHVQEFMTAASAKPFDRERLTMLCRLAGKDSQRVTDPLPDIMNKKIEKWYKDLGFDVAIQSVTAGYEMPKAHALQIGWPPSANFFRTDEDNHWSQAYDPSVPEGEVDITHTFDVIAAIKTHA